MEEIYGVCIFISINMHLHVHVSVYKLDRHVCFAAQPQDFEFSGIIQLSLITQVQKSCWSSVQIS